MEYIEALINPVLVPYYGFWVIFSPSKERTDKHWHLKVSFYGIFAV